MVYNRRYRPRRYRSRKPLRRLAKRAYRRKSAGAQASQIAKIARHVSTLKHTVNKELKLPCIYRSAFQTSLKSSNQFLYPVVIPLTSGLSQDSGQGAIGALPTTNLLGVHNGQAGVGPAIPWEPIFQSRELKPNQGDANRASVPAWAKIFRQTCTLRFLAGTLQNPNTITVSVVRVNPKQISNIKGIAQRLDGQDFHGPEPDAGNALDLIRAGQDYVASDGITFGPTAAGQPPTMPSTNSDGKMNIHCNKEMWTVEYQKQLTLGAALNPLRATPQSPLTDARPSYAPAQMVPDRNQYEETCKFSVNYGGMKLSSVPPLDGTNVALNPMEVTAMQYNNIPVEHKRWLVIHQSYPQSGDTPYAPYMQYNSIISAQVPA